MGNLHEMIVDNISKVVCRHAIALKQYWVFKASRSVGDSVLAVLDGTVDDIVEGWVFVWRLKADDMELALCSSLFGFRGGKVVATAVVLNGKPVGLAFMRKSLKTRGAAKTAVGMTVREEIMCMGTVEI